MPREFLAARPVRVIGGVVIGFRMRHQAKNSAGGVTYSGDVIHRSIGVERESAPGRLAVGECILNGHLVVLP